MRMPIFFKYQRHHGGYVFESKERVLVPSNPNAEIEEGIFSELALYEFLDATLGETYPQLTEAKVLSFSDRWGSLSKSGPCHLQDFEKLALHIRSQRIRIANNALRKRIGKKSDLANSSFTNAHLTGKFSMVFAECQETSEVIPHIEPESLADCIWLTFIVKGENSYERCQYHKSHGIGRPGCDPGCWVYTGGKSNKGRKMKWGKSSCRSANNRKKALAA